MEWNMQKKERWDLIFFLHDLLGIFLSETTKEKISSFGNKLRALLRVNF